MKVASAPEEKSSSFFNVFGQIVLQGKLSRTGYGKPEAWKLSFLSWLDCSTGRQQVGRSCGYDSVNKNKGYNHFKITLAFPESAQCAQIELRGPVSVLKR